MAPPLPPPPSVAAQLWSSADAAARWVNPSLPFAPPPPTRATDAHWLVPPAHTVADWAAWSLLFFAVLALLPSRACGGRRALWRVAVPAAPQAASGAAAAADAALRAGVWATAASTLWLKLSTGRGLFLLQPCHLSNALLCALTLAPGGGGGGGGGDSLAARAAWVDALAKYGTAAALLWPDIGPDPAPGEVTSFFLQHALLCALPALWIARRRYPLYAGARALAYAWAVVGAIHFAALLPASVLAGKNVNYMMMPPPGVYPKSLAPIAWYRSVIALAGIPLALAMRYAVLAPIAAVGATAPDACGSGSRARASIKMRLAAAASAGQERETPTKVLRRAADGKVAADSGGGDAPRQGGGRDARGRSVTSKSRARRR